MYPNAATIAGSIAYPIKIDKNHAIRISIKYIGLAQGLNKYNPIADFNYPYRF